MAVRKAKRIWFEILILLLNYFIIYVGGTEIMYRESEIIELKTSVTSNLCKEIIAFANTKGGTIYIGYDDESNLIGVKNAKKELDKISNMISDCIEPNMTFNVSMEIIEELGKEIIVIKVLKGTKRPYYLKSKGMISEGVYIRLGATNRQANRDEIVKMMIEDNGVKFEDNISRNQNLTFDALKKEFENKEIALDDTKMKNIGLINEYGLYTNLAYIVSDQNTYPIKIAIYKGNDKVEFLDKKEFENISVFEQIQEIETFLKLLIKIPAKIVGMKRIENPEYNLEALRESILNSIVHRDYSVDGNTLINIYEDNIEIVNVGGLISGLTVDAIKRGSSATRNPKLAALFHRLGYIEAYGSGIPRILAQYKHQKLKPRIEPTENSFFIIFPKMNNVVEELNEEMKKIIELLQENKTITREDVENLFDCGKTMALRKLNKCIEQKLIRQVKEGRKTYYELM